VRAYIKRTVACMELLDKVVLDHDNYFDMEYWLFESNESFHGEVSKNGKFYKFMDQRLPEFKLPIKFVRVEEQ